MVLVPDPGTITIGTGEVHAWLLELDGWPSGRELLDSAERDRSASYLRPQDGARYAASRDAVRVILAGYIGGEPGHLRFAADRHGRPQLAGHGLQFSLSRSRGVALMAVSAHPVGCDLEFVRHRSGLADLAGARFAAAEAACIAGGCAGTPTRSFYRHWVAKEAYLKATGRGLAALRDTEFACDPAPAIRFRGTPEPGWLVTLTDVSPGMLAAIAATHPVTACRRLAAPDQSAGVGRRARHRGQDRSGRIAEPDPGAVRAGRAGRDGDLVTVLQPRS